MKATLVWMVIAAVGCASLRSKADDAYAQGDYLAAQELYDRVVAEHPDDQGARARRDDARNAVLRVLLFQAETQRAARRDDVAAGRLAELLERRDAWDLDVDPRLAPQIAGAVDATGRWLQGLVAARTKVGPLAGEALVGNFRRLLVHRDFAPTAHALAEVVRQAGQARCDALAPATPYASWVVARYCAHFDVTRPVAALPGLVGSLALDGTVSGESADQTAALHAALVRAFQRSVWFDARATAAARGTIDGHIAAAYDAHPVTRTRTWTETVSYTEYETSQESYQEPYDDTETYTESVPSTEYQTTTVTCGDTTCTEQTPVTVYHDETRTRTVTRYRTAYRTVTNPVTKYRDEDRSFSYAAIERTGRYTSALRVRVTGEIPEATAALDSTFVQSGDDHDVTNGAAGVAPERANLLTIDGLALREQVALADRLGEVLDERWDTEFCTATTYDVEAAARCAYRDARRAPAPAHAALATLLGGDEPFVAPLLVRPL